MAGWASGPSGLAGWPRGGNGKTDGKSPILLDFVPYRGRCSASPHENHEKVEQGKGTADHLMPLGYLFYFPFPFFPSFSLLFSSEIYCPTQFTVRRQGGQSDPPDPPSRTPLHTPPPTHTDILSMIGETGGSKDLPRMIIREQAVAEIQRREVCWNFAYYRDYSTTERPSSWRITSICQHRLWDTLIEVQFPEN